MVQLNISVQIKIDQNFNVKIFQDESERNFYL